VLDKPQVVSLAHEIANRVKAKLASSGPFRSVQEFLAPSDLFGGTNLLEAAIAVAKGSDGKALNEPSAVPEFSSQWLTSGDLMTTLAPTLFARSDTFVIRAYGETTNPATGERMARAWLEARVQRFPEFIDSTQPPETPLASLNSVNRALGRKFKILSLRWLDSLD
jgi:hypothetical protein